MQVKTHIGVVYTATVTIPTTIWEQFGHLPMYEEFTYAVDKKNNAVSGGSNSYSEVEEWAEFHNKRAAHSWVSDWIAKINEWEALGKQES